MSIKKLKCFFHREPIFELNVPYIFRESGVLQKTIPNELEPINLKNLQEGVSCLWTLAVRVYTRR